GDGVESVRIVQVYRESESLTGQVDHQHGGIHVHDLFPVGIPVHGDFDVLVSGACREKYLSVVVGQCVVGTVDKHRGMGNGGVVNAILHAGQRVRCLDRAGEKNHQQQGKKETKAMMIHDKLSPPAHISAHRSKSL